MTKYNSARGRRMLPLFSFSNKLRGSGNHRFSEVAGGRGGEATGTGSMGGLSLAQKKRWLPLPLNLLENENKGNILLPLAELYFVITFFF
jgi:hypothetical protein